MIVDLILAVARRTAEFSAFATLLSVRLADPRAERSDQFGAVRPQINVVAGVRAKLASRTVILAHAARFAGYVRQTQTARIVSTRSIVANVHVEVLAERALAAGAMAHSASD